ncbi:MAG TPA: hypothetical protein VHN14_03980 [Kofleriaceae bacterium]|nr:hypothetical protein [Kofleriaceae bacterium]
MITDFLRTVPEAWQEEWIATQATDVSAEARARRDLGRLTEVALRKMWPQIDHASTPSREYRDPRVGVSVSVIRIASVPQRHAADVVAIA